MGVPRCVEKGFVVAILGEDIGSVVPAIERVIDEPIIDSARQASHEPTLLQSISECQEKRTDTNFSLDVDEWPFFWR